MPPHVPARASRPAARQFASAPCRAAGRRPIRARPPRQPIRRRRRSCPSAGRAVPASQPTMGAPSGVPPMKQIRYSAMTRPRIVGATPSCTEVFAAVVSVSIANPAGTSSTAVAQNPGMTPARTSQTPNAIAARMRNAVVGRRVRRVARIAPAHAPTRERRGQQPVAARVAVEDLFGQQRRGDLEVQPERADDEDQDHRQQQVGTPPDVPQPVAQLALDPVAVGATDAARPSASAPARSRQPCSRPHWRRTPTRCRPR